MNLSIVGLGKLGLPFAYFLASHGHNILAFDKNQKIYNHTTKNNNESKNVVVPTGLGVIPLTTSEYLLSVGHRATV